MPEILRKCFRPLALAAIATTVSATVPAAFATVPKVVVDAQVAGPTGFSSPQSMAMAPNNTYYVADTGNNRVLAFTGGNQSTVSTGAFSLNQPQALAVDSAGDLFIGDSTGLVIEAMATNGSLNGSVRSVVSGGPLTNVIALAVDNNPSSSTFGTLYVGDYTSNAVYTVAPNSGTAVKLDAPGLPSGLIPSALLKDAAGDLFIADLNSTLYEIPAGGGSAQTYVIPGFVVWGPTGLAVDPKGNLYVLTLTCKGTTAECATTAQPVPENIIEIPNVSGSLDPTNAYMVPFTGAQNASAVAIDSSGSIYILDWNNNNVTKLYYGAPVSFGSTQVGKYGSHVMFNYEMNASFQQGGFKVDSKGDFAQGSPAEVVNSTNTCRSTVFTDGINGGPISPSNPYLCQASWAANPVYPGIRTGTVQFYTTGGYVLASVPFYETGLSGASVVYPMTATKTARNVGSPVALAVSGLDQNLFEVDYAGARILHINGPDGKTKAQVSTSPISLFTPIGIALNDQGDIYIAEAAFGAPNPGDLVVLPRLKGETPYKFNPGNLLQHPISVAFDSAGDLLIGDSGSAGQNADEADPGYIVEVPAGGGPAFKLNTGGTTIIYPQTIAADPYTGDIYVGDGGDFTGAGAKVVRIPPGGGSAAVVTPTTEPNINPVSIVFDPAGQYYVLDKNTGTITVVPPNGGAAYLLPFNNQLLTSPSALAITNGGRNLVIGNSGTNDQPASFLVFLNGESSTLNFGKVPKNGQSDPMTAFLANVGSAGLELDRPYYTASPANADFDFQSTSTCASSLALAPAGRCEMDVEFQPTKRGRQTQVLTFDTNGFRPNDSVLTFKGTGSKPVR